MPMIWTQMNIGSNCSRSKLPQKLPRDVDASSASGGPLWQGSCGNRRRFGARHIPVMPGEPKEMGALRLNDTFKKKPHHLTGSLRALRIGEASLEAPA